MLLSCFHKVSGKEGQWSGRKALTYQRASFNGIVLTLYGCSSLSVLILEYLLQWYVKEIFNLLVILLVPGSPDKAKRSFAYKTESVVFFCIFSLTRPQSFKLFSSSGILKQGSWSDGLGTDWKKKKKLARKWKVKEILKRNYTSTKSAKRSIFGIFDLIARTVCWCNHHLTRQVNSAVCSQQLLILLNAVKGKLKKRICTWETCTKFSVHFTFQ